MANIIYDQKKYVTATQVPLVGQRDYGVYQAPIPQAAVPDKNKETKDFEHLNEIAQKLAETLLKQVNAKNIRLSNDTADREQVFYLLLSDFLMLLAKFTGTTIFQYFAALGMAKVLWELYKGGTEGIESSETRTEILKAQQTTFADQNAISFKKAYILDYLTSDKFKKLDPKIQESIKEGLKADLRKLSWSKERRNAYFKDEITNQMIKKWLFGYFQKELGRWGGLVLSGSALHGGISFVSTGVASGALTVVSSWMITVISIALTITLLYTCGWYFKKYLDARSSFAEVESREAAKINEYREQIKKLPEMFAKNPNLIPNLERNLLREIEKCQLSIDVERNHMETRFNKFVTFAAIALISLAATALSIAFIATGIGALAVAAFTLIGLTLGAMKLYYNYNEKRKLHEEVALSEIKKDVKDEKNPKADVDQKTDPAKIEKYPDLKSSIKFNSPAPAPQYAPSGIACS